MHPSSSATRRLRARGLVALGLAWWDARLIGRRMVVAFGLLTALYAARIPKENS